MKKFISGFLCCFILTTGVVFAANYNAVTANFKIFVDDKEYINEDKPAVIINGSTYLPLRALGNVLKVPVTWDDTNKKVSIGQMPVTKSQDGLELTIFNHGRLYQRYIAADFEIKNNSGVVQKFNSKSFLLRNYQAIALKNQLASSTKQDIELESGEVYKDSMLFAFTDVGGIILEDEKPYLFTFMCGNTRMEIKYYY